VSGTTHQLMVHTDDGVHWAGDMKTLVKRLVYK